MENARLSGQVISLSTQVDFLQKAEAQRKKEMEEMRKIQAQLREQQQHAQRQAASQAEQYRRSLMSRDPIHLYVRVNGKMQLVLDYHEGAFSLQISQNNIFIEYPQGHQHGFEIIATPESVESMKGLPVVPKKLCPYF
jgi:hypothetical protein